MKKDEPRKPSFASIRQNAVSARPVAPVATRQAVSDRRSPDPSSVLRSDRYPIPSFFEYRMRATD